MENIKVSEESLMKSFREWLQSEDFEEHKHRDTHNGLIGMRGYITETNVNKNNAQFMDKLINDYGCKYLVLKGWD